MIIRPYITSIKRTVYYFFHEFFFSHNFALPTTSSPAGAFHIPRFLWGSQLLNSFNLLEDLFELYLMDKTGSIMHPLAKVIMIKVNF